MDFNKSFEDEMLSINPEYDLIFGRQDEARLNQAVSTLEPHSSKKPPQNKMKIISKMNKLIGSNKSIGELPTHSDWDETESTERETIALMRRLGLEQSIDRAPDESRTISTVPVTDDVIFMRNGHKKMSIFMADSYFKLKPRMPPDFGTDQNDASLEDSITSEYSDDVNLYRPIKMDSNTETEMSTISEDGMLGEEQKPVPVNTNFDSGVSSDSYKRPPVEEFPELNWRHRSAQQPGSSRGKKPDRGSYNNRGNNKWRRSSGSESASTSSSSSGWRRSSTTASGSDAREENNWRKRVTKVPDPEKDNQQAANKETTTEMKPNPIEVSNCGSPLYKPRDLFMKKKAMMIQKVFAENQP